LKQHKTTQKGFVYAFFTMFDEFSIREKLNNAFILSYFPLLVQEVLA
jgi:hypothetical protein